MRAVLTSLKLLRLHLHAALWLVPGYALLCLIFALDDKPLLLSMNVMIIGQLQGLFLKQGFSRESAFLLPEHHKVQLLTGLFLGALLVLFAAVVLLLLAKSDVLLTCVWLLAGYVLAMGLGYYRKGGFGFILVILYCVFILEDFYLPVEVFLHALPVYLFASVVFIAGVYLLIFRAMKNQEFIPVDSRNTAIFGWHNRSMHFTEPGLFVSLLGQQFSNSEKKSAINRFYLSALSLPRKLAIYGEDAAFSSWLITVIAAASICAAMVSRFFSAAEILTVMALLLPLIAVVAPYINELSESRSRIARFWLKDDSNNRRQFMVRLVRGHILRLCYPFFVWCVVVSAGYILLDVDNRWSNLYLAGFCTLTLGCMLGFFCALLRGRLSAVVNFTLRVVYTFATAGCIFLAYFLPLYALYLSGCFVVLTFVAITFWTRRDLELN